jgi:uncharacterized protein involved in type VI secretion and phage assembly
MPDLGVEKFKLKLFFLEDKLLSADVVEVVVDTNVFLPTMFSVVIQDDPDPTLGIFKYLDLDPRFQIGASVSVGFEVTDRITGVVPISNTLVNGEITSVEPIFLNGRAQLRIRGYDRLHRLMRGKKTRAFMMQNEMSIITMIAGEAGFSPFVTGVSPELQEYVLQYNQSNWDFLNERARLYGYQIYADGRILKVTPADTPRSLIPVSLKWGENLSRFEPRLVSVGQATQTSVPGWDSGKQMKVKGVAVASVQKTKIGELLTGNATALKAFGKAEEVMIPNSVVGSQNEAMTIAKASFDENQSQFIKASGELALGDPNLVAGAMAIVTGVGTRFSGTYYITEAKHIWREGSYTVQFQVSGRNPYTIRHLLGVDNSRPDKIDGVVIGVVTSVRDPLNMGRIKVKFPWFPSSLSEVESSWARLALPGAGMNRGLYFTPEVNDEVLVAFENGDMNYPYIVGALWNKMSTPPRGSSAIVGPDGKVNQRILTSRSGHTIILDDTQGKEQIIIKDKTTKNSIIFDSVKNAMTISAAGDLTIEAGGKLIMSSKLDFSLKSNTKGAIEANQGANVKVGTSEVDLQMTGATVKGTTVAVQANTQASVKGNAMVQIQGGIVQIN